VRAIGALVPWSVHNTAPKFPDIKTPRIKMQDIQIGDLVKFKSKWVKGIWLVVEVEKTPHMLILMKGKIRLRASRVSSTKL
jgi:hypothetical protein